MREEGYYTILHMESGDGFPNVTTLEGRRASHSDN